MADLGKLLSLVTRLRAPGGCPWDREQSLGDLRAYLLEEAHEAAAAIDEVVACGGDGADENDRSAEVREAWDSLAEELGDVLFQCAFVATLAAERKAFTAEGAISRVHRKMIERHPHVFPPSDGGETREIADAAAVSRAWESRKQSTGGAGSILAGVPTSLPALLAAYRMTQKASGVGFDWPKAEDVLVKLDEERAELAEALAAAGDDAPAASEAVREEIGDLLFTAANLARKLGIDPEGALAGSNAKFRRRFSAVEARLRADGRLPDECDLAELDALWQEVKHDG